MKRDLSSNNEIKTRSMQSQPTIVMTLEMREVVPSYVKSYLRATWV